MPGRMIKKILQTFLPAALLMIALFPASAQADSEIYTIQAIGDFETASCRRMLDDINYLRAYDAWYWDSSDTEKITVSGLRPLVYDYSLERVAMQRAAELAAYYSHTRPNGERCFTAYTEEFDFGGMGENIAYGYESADAVFEGWAEEDKPYAGQGHRRNMLNSGFRSVGVGCFECDGILFWAQEFPVL